VSERLGAPTSPGRSNWNGMKFGGLLVFGKLCSTPIFWPDWRMSSWRKWLTEIFAIGRFGVLVLYLEMPEHIGRTQGVGEYCGGVC